MVIGGIATWISRELLMIHIAYAATMGIYYETEDMALRAMAVLFMQNPAYYHMLYTIKTEAPRVPVKTGWGENVD